MTLWTTSRRFFHLRAALCQNLTKFQFCDSLSPTSELSHISRVSYTLASQPQLSLSRLPSQDLDKTLSYSVSATGKRGRDPGQSLQAGLCDLRQSTVEWRDVPAGRERTRNNIDGTCKGLKGRQALCLCFAGKWKLPVQCPAWTALNCLQTTWSAALGNPGRIKQNKYSRQQQTIVVISFLSMSYLHGSCKGPFLSFCAWEGVKKRLFFMGNV